MNDQVSNDEILSTLLNRENASNEPIFAEPWQAQVFALTVRLHDNGLFTWPEWSASLASEIKAFALKGREDYFLCWLNALEALLIRKEVAKGTELSHLTSAWREAYRTTPHGKPVSLA